MRKFTCKWICPYDIRKNKLMAFKHSSELKSGLCAYMFAVIIKENFIAGKQFSQSC